MNISIREANKGDLAVILNLYQEPGFDDPEVLDLASARRIFERMGKYPNYTLYVAEVGGEIAGTFALLIMDNLAHLGTPSGILEDMVVGAKWRGQGIGKRMIAIALEQCRQAGCYKLALSSNVKRTGAHSFYEDLGFERYGYCFEVKVNKQSESGITAQPGTYALILRALAAQDIQVGRLGRLLVLPGVYVYVGSAFGPGGLMARVGRHQRKPPAPHWHIDHLRRVTELVEVWFTYDPIPREHEWADIFRNLPGAGIPLKGFGASDCGCKAHLFYFETKPSEDKLEMALLRQGVIPSRYALCSGEESRFSWK